MFPAQIVWNDATTEVPDADTTVLVGFADGEVDLGYFDGEHWRNQENCRFTEFVEFWADVPAVPTRAKVERRVA